jgi:hypothetical protein
MFSRIFTVSAFSAALVSALSISQQCETALTSVVASPDASCLDGSALVSLFLNSNTTSIVGPINTWAAGMCALPPCTNATLAAVVANVTSGCSAEFSAFGLTSSDESSATQVVQEAYPAFRQVICLQDTSTKTLCVTETLTNIQSILGTLSISNAENVVANALALTSFPANVTCTDCIKQAYNIFEKDFPSEVSDITGPLQSLCGSSFTDGSTPSDISDIASSSSSGAVPAFLSRGAFTGVAVAMLVVVSSAVTFFA